MKQYVDLDLTGNQLLNVRAQVLGADPTTPASGQYWYRSDLSNGTGTGVLRYRDSSGNTIQVATGNTALSNAYSTVTDGTTPQAASGGDTLTVAASGTGLTVATAAKTVTYTLASSAAAAANKVVLSGAGGKIIIGYLSQVLATTDLTDITAKTGTGTTVVFSTSPTLSAPVIAATTAATAAGAISYNTSILWMGDGTTAHQIVTVDAAQTLTNKTLTQPAIADFTLATHNHTTTATGGTLTHAAITDFDTQVRTSRLDQMATNTVNLSIGSNRLINVADPVNAQDAATKNYVDLSIQGTPLRTTAYYATTAALPAATYANGTAGVGATLTATANAALPAIDGQTPVVNDVVLVRNQVTGSQNGLYTVTQVGDGTHPFILTRHPDMDTSAEMSGAIVAVESGTVNGGSLWMLALNAPTVGTTALPFTELNKAADLIAGNGIQLVGNTVSLNINPRLVFSGAQLDLASGIVTAGTYSQLTVDTYGRVTAGVELSTVSGFIVRTGANAYTGRILSGTTNRISVTNTDGLAGNPTFDISAAYQGQNTIVTVGTITAGVWSGTIVGLLYGGSGVDASTAAGAGTSRDTSHFGRPATAPTNTTNVTTAASGIPTMIKSTITANGVATSFTINHNLGNTTPLVQVYDSAGNEIVTNVQSTDANNSVLSWTTAPANASTWGVVIVG